MKLSDCIPDRGYLPRIACHDKEEAIGRLVEVLAEAGLVADGKALAAEIVDREVGGSTDVGDGLSVPHVRSRQADRCSVVVATLAEPLDVPTEDGLPVEIMILIVAPFAEPRQMLRTLARVARLVKNEDIIPALKAAETPAALRDVITAAE